ncbi:MAG: sulfatase family protein [Planctomycetota bacterium]|jgi:arylsulfatase A-like enzyme
MNSIVLVVDRLHAGYVGAYGNCWIETPSLDRLASQATVFDQFLIGTPQREALCRSYWLGQHPLCPGARVDETATLPSLLASHDVATLLASDEPVVCRHPLAGAFDSTLHLDPPEPGRVCRNVDQTHLAQSFAQIIDRVESVSEPFLLWCHLASLGRCWDAPWEFRARYVEPGDPDPPESAEVPSRRLEEDEDPDRLLGITQAYAGQVSLLDVCLGALLEFLDGHPARRRTLLAVVSARGFPLGEHGSVGTCDSSLYAELVHVPLLIRFPDSLGEAARCQALTQPADLFSTLLDWWGAGDRPDSPGAATLMPLVRGDVESIRDRLCLAAAEGHRAIRTPAWYFLDAADPELFLKPDDRWEVNDVSDRCADIVELLRQAMAVKEEAFRSGDPGRLPPIDEVLRDGPD